MNDALDHARLAYERAGCGCIVSLFKVRRADIVQQLQADVSGYTASEVDDMIKKLHAAKLIRSQQGPHARALVA